MDHADGKEIHIQHTYGYSPGACCFYLPDAQVILTGDTLMSRVLSSVTGRSFSDFSTIVGSIRAKLLTLPPAITVHTSHGGDITLGAEVQHPV